MTNSEKYVGITKLTLKIQEIFYITKVKTYHEETSLISKLIANFINENYEIKESV